MITEKMQMRTNARLVAKVLTKYRDTFYALKELINNSLYAKASRINIDFIPSECDRDSICFHSIEKIRITDNGFGVSYSDFKKSIMEIATDNKSDGYGVGRFSALQIGRCMHISTTAYDATLKQYTKTEVDFNIRQFQKDDLQSKDFDVRHSVLEGSQSTAYQAEISELYTNTEGCKRKNKLGKEFANDTFPQKLFESYPLYIFEGKVKFYFNGNELKRTDFTTGEPTIKKASYTDITGKKHDVIFTYYSLKLNEPKVRLFLQCLDGNINYTALELMYNSNWYAPSLGTQFVLIESDYLTRDFCDNYELVHLSNKEWISFSSFLKKEIDEHYKKGNVKYTKFLEKLQKDKSYPFTISEIETNSLSVDLFNQSAFILEDDLKILETGANNKSLIYTLLRKVIDDGNISFIIEHVMGLSADSKAKLIDLLDRTNLEAVVNYTSSLAKMEQTLELLNKITVCEVDKHTEQFADISVLLSRNMWLFGEQYMGSIAIEPEEDICRVLDGLFKTYISYKPQSKKYDNQIEDCKRKVKSLPSMAFYSERKLAGNEKDILCVVMLAPSIKANQYDLAQIDNYIYQLEKDNTIVKEGVKFRIYFIVSMLADFAKSQIITSAKDREPFLYKNRNLNGNDIKAYLLEWKQLIRYNKELLSYASTSLKLNKIDVESAFMQEYSEFIEKKNTAQLHVVK